MKSIKHVLLASVALLYCLTVSSHDFERGGIYYNFPEQQDLADPVVTVTYRGNYHDSYRNEYQGIVKIPSTVNYWGTTYRVVGIEDNAFRDCDYLTSVNIPNGVTKIPKDCFYYCRSLASVIIPESVTEIGEGAFYYCSNLSSITIPWRVSRIAKTTFARCYSLESIDLSHVYYIDAYAFAESGLSSITLSNAYKIGEGAFQLCEGLKNIINFSKLDIRKGSEEHGGIAYYAEKVINADEAIGDFYFSQKGDKHFLVHYEGNDKTLVLPKNYNGGEYQIGAEVFMGNTIITKVIIPHSVSIIGNKAFANCANLTSVQLAKGISTIGHGAFENCNLLSSISLPEDLKHIGSDAFKGCYNLKNINMPASVMSIGGSAFEGCDNLNKVYINSIKDWCMIMFENAYANPLYYAKTLYFENQIITKLTIPKGTIRIGSNAFCNLKSVTSVTLPNDIREIKKKAFQNCEKLTSINIPQSVTSIEDYAFSGCTSLCRVVIEDGSQVLTLGANSSENEPKSPSSNKDVYGSNTLGKGLFSDCPLEYVYLGRNLNYNTDSRFGFSPFYKNSSLYSVIIGDEVTKIENHCFSGCNRFTSITLPIALTEIGAYAFRDCRNLTRINIPKNVTKISECAFSGCNNLKSIFISSIEAWCRINFSAPNANPLYYGKYLFLNEDIVTNLIIPSNVTKIGKWAFYGCKSLAIITIPESVTKIEENAFKGCGNLRHVSIPKKSTKLVKLAFGEEKSIVVNGKEKKYKL